MDQKSELELSDTEILDVVWKRLSGKTRILNW